MLGHFWGGQPVGRVHSQHLATMPAVGAPHEATCGAKNAQQGLRGVNDLSAEGGPQEMVAIDGSFFSGSMFGISVRYLMLHQYTANCNESYMNHVDENCWSRSEMNQSEHMTRFLVFLF